MALGQLSLEAASSYGETVKDTIKSFSSGHLPHDVFSPFKKIKKSVSHNRRAPPLSESRGVCRRREGSFWAPARQTGLPVPQGSASSPFSTASCEMSAPLTVSKCRIRFGDFKEIPSGTNRVSLLHAAELGRSKAPGFGGIQRGVQLESPRAAGQGVASGLGAYPKPGSP